MKITGLQNNPNDTQNKVTKFLHLVDMAKYEFIDYEHVEKDEEIRKLKYIIPINFPKRTDKGEFIVPIEYLYAVEIPKHEEVDFINHENGEEFLREVKNAINFSISIDFSIYLEYIDECTSLLPSRCQYTFNGWDSFKDELGSPFENKFDTISEQLCTIHISQLIFPMVLSFKELQLIKEMISSENSKNYLREVYLDLNTFDEVIEILDLISECSHIESITLKYQEVYRLDMGGSEETIREVKNKYLKKFNLTSKIEIIHKPRQD